MAISLIRILAFALAVMALSKAKVEPAATGTVFGTGTLLHAHNCYPEDGRWLDRIDRALGTGLARVAIEQDVAWVPPADGRPGRSVVSHDTGLSGTEPALEQHFFARIRPLMERALAENRRERWPLLVLHLDFKSNEPEHHQAVWDLLARHRSWLTTAERVSDTSRVMPFQAGPLLVLTENGPGQEAAFSERVLIGDRLLLFGTTPSPVLPPSEDPAERARLAVSAPVAALIPWPATNYRRWTNFAWNVVERGGPNRAGDWTPNDASRLRAIVDRAHAQGLWVRFYTLNGHPDADRRGCPRAMAGRHCCRRGFRRHGSVRRLCADVTGRRPRSLRR
ncbi:MAG: hypothetical protein AB7N29_20310, partial [Vicinamibacterales bacterium]